MFEGRRPLFRDGLVRPPLGPAATRLVFSAEEASRSMYYVQRGTVPRQRHTQHRAADGSLYAEELFGVEASQDAHPCSTT